MKEIQWRLEDLAEASIKRLVQWRRKVSSMRTRARHAWLSRTPTGRSKLFLEDF